MFHQTFWSAIRIIQHAQLEYTFNSLSQNKINIVRKLTSQLTLFIEHNIENPIII